MLKNLRQKMEDMKYRFIVKNMLAEAKLTEAKENIHEFNKDNRGIAIIEVILILVIVMALGMVFRDKIKGLFDTIFNQITNSGGEIIKNYP